MKALASRVLMFAVVLFGLLALSQPVKVKAFTCFRTARCVSNDGKGKIGHCGGSDGCLCVFKDGTSMEDVIDCSLF